MTDKMRDGIAYMLQHPDKTAALDFLVCMANARAGAAPPDFRMWRQQDR